MLYDILINSQVLFCFASRVFCFFFSLRSWSKSVSCVRYRFDDDLIEFIWIDQFSGDDCSAVCVCVYELFVYYSIHLNFNFIVHHSFNPSLHTIHKCVKSQKKIRDIKSLLGIKLLSKIFFEETLQFSTFSLFFKGSNLHKKSYALEG